MRWVAISIFLCVLGLATAGSPTGDIVPENPQYQRRYNAEDPISVVIFLKEPAVAKQLIQMKQSGQAVSRKAATALRQRQDRLQQAVIDRLESQRLAVQEGWRFHYLLNGFAATTKWGDLAAIRALPEVARVILDEPMAAFEDNPMNESVALIHAPSVWALQDALARPVIGTGVRIAIIDTGVDYTHPDLGGGFGTGFRVAAGYDLYNQDSDPMDDNGHGTHVTGIAAANGAMVGVAPGATIYAYKVLGASGNGLTSITAAGIEMAVDPDGDPTTDDGADVINMSLGGGGGTASASAEAAEMATQLGVVVVASAGNDGRLGRVGAPAIAPSVIAVASASGAEADSYSSCATVPATLFKPEIAAPGNQVYSTLPGGQYGYKSGTSMASPHIAGAAALIRQLHPQWTPSRVKRFLVNRTDYLSAESFTCMGAGLVNLDYVDDPIALEMDFPAAWYGMVDIEAETDRLSQDIVLYNVTDTVQMATPIGSATDPDSGISYEMGGPVAIQPGESGIVHQTLVLDNARVPFSPNPDALSIDQSGIQVNGQVLPFLNLFRKAYTLGIDSPFQSEHRVTVLSNGVMVQAKDINFAGYDELFLGPGEYTVLSVELELNHDRPSFWLATEAVTFGEGSAATHVISQANRDQFKEFSVNLTDRDGSPIDLQQFDKSYELLILGWDSSFSYGLFDFKAAKYSVGSLSGVATNLAGYVKRNDRDDYIGYNWFNGGDGQMSTSVDLDLADYKHVKWAYLGNGYSESNRPALLVVHNEQLGLSILPGAYRSGPGPYRFQTWEPILQDLDAVDPRRTLGRSLLHYGDGFDIGQKVVATSTQTITRIDYRPDSIEAQEEFVADEFSMGRHVCVSQGAVGTQTTNGMAAFYWQGVPEYPLTDCFGSQFQDLGMQLTLRLPDGSERQATAIRALLDQASPEPGEYTFHMTYNGRLRGEAVPSTLEQRFTLVEGVGLYSASIERLKLLRGEAIAEVVTGSETLQLTLAGPTPGMVQVWFDRGDGWEEQHSVTITGNTYHFPVLAPTSGQTVGLRVMVSGPQENELELVIPRAFHVGFSRQLPWVVANEKWSSRIALTNIGTEAANVTLVARNTEGTEAVVSRVLPPESVQSFDAEALFNMNGYNLMVISDVDTVHPSLLTLAQRPGQEPSPAQSEAISLDTPSNNLSFGNLEGDQVPAIVLSAPFKFLEPDGVTLVSLEYVPRFMPPQTTTISLTGARPFAATLASLFPDVPLADDAWLYAKSQDQTRLVGTLFGFNQALETSMANAAGFIRDTGELLLPWVVANETWESEISFFNHDPYMRSLQLTARTTEGVTQSLTLDILPFEVKTQSASELFPGLTRYSLSMSVGTGNFTAGMRLSNKATPSGNSPARVGAIDQYDTSENILFGYLAGDQVPAVVLNAPWAAADTPVAVTLLGAGGPLAEAQILLEGGQPTATLLADLFPGIELPADMAVLARAPDGIALAGITFTFNQNGEPAMAAATPLNP